MVNQKRLQSNAPLSWLCVSLALHAALLVRAGILFQDTTFAVAGEAVGISLDLVPGVRPAQAAMIAEAPAAEPMTQEAPPPPASPPSPPDTLVQEDAPDMAPPVRPQRKPSPRRVEQKAPPAQHSEQRARLGGAMSGPAAQEAVPAPPPGAPLGEGGGAPNGTEARVSSEPDYLRNPPPVYPRESRKNGEEGVVTVAAKISRDGHVLSLFVKKSSSYDRLDAAAISAVKEWKFRPAMLAGIAVESDVDVPVRFFLR